ncbi:MAG: ROK family protein [Motilibacteraceae bacterium]
MSEQGGHGGPAAAGRAPHQGTLLRLLREHGPTSRSGLAELTGLSPTTVGKAVGPLVESGVLREVAEPPRGGLGRPALLLHPVPEAVAVCGVQISVGTVRVGLADGSADVRALRVLPVAVGADPRTVLGAIAGAVRELLDDHGGTCLGVGVAVPGPVDPDGRRVRLAANLGWRDVPVADVLEEQLGLPVVVDHNVRSMALGEARYGGRGTDTLAYLYVRTGVGLGLTLDGQPFYGGAGGESHLGHVKVVDDGILCSCGAHGCLETGVAEPYLLRALAALDVDPAPGVLPALHAAAAAGNAGAVVLEERVLDTLAGALATVVDLFTPGLVLVGGLLAEAPERQVTTLRERTRDRLFPLLREDFRLERADGSDAALVRAAAAVALERLHYA